MNKTVLLVIVALLAINAAGTWMLVTQRNKIDRLAIGREKAAVIEKYGSKILDEFNGNAAKAREEGARRKDIKQLENLRVWNEEYEKKTADYYAKEEKKKLAASGSATNTSVTNKPPSKKPLEHDPNDPRWKFPSK